MLQIPLWLYMAVMAAGSAAQYQGAKKVDKERAKAMAEERMRREKLSRENEASADKSKNLFANARAREDARAAEIAQQITPTASQPVATAAQSGLLDPSSPPHATESVAGARDAITQARSEAATRAQAIAAANSFGSVFGDAGRSAGRNAQDIDMNSASMRRWNETVLPARLEYANQTGREWSTTGDILKLVGTIMAPMALGGGGAGAATGQGTTAADIAVARGGDVAQLAQGFGAGGSIPFGSAAGIGEAGFGAAGLVQNEAQMAAMRKLWSGMALTDAERALIHMKF